MLRDLLVRCGLVVGTIEADRELVEAAEQVQEAVTEWKEAIQRHATETAQLKPPAPMRRIK